MTSEQPPAGDRPFSIEISEPRQWKRVIGVTIQREHFDSEYSRRLGREIKTFERPGFRKGKAPRQMVEQVRGDHVRAETLESLVPQAFKAAMVEHELLPLTDPELRDLRFEDGEPITFDLHVEVRPRVTAQDYDDLPLKRREVAVSTEGVDEVLERLRESRAIWQAVDRPGQTGDQLTVDLERLGETDPDSESEPRPDQKMVLGAEHNLSEFNEQLAGAVVGDVREIEVPYPDDYPNPDLAGRRIRFRCSVKEVGEKILPDLDDAFAAQVAEGRTLLELRGEIRRQLERDAAERIDREVEEQIVERLIERHDVEVPPSLVEQYLNSSVEELHARNLQVGRQISEEDDRQFRELTRPVAERVLRGMFIMEAIRRQEGIQVTDEEIDDRIAEIARENGFDLEKYREYAARGSEREKIRHGLEERKAFDFLLSRASVETVPADAEIDLGANATAPKNAAESAAGDGE
jgi:trigger factor